MYQYRAYVHNIVDGDTFDAKVDLGFYIQTDLRFRVENIDTPEIYGVKHESEEYARGIEATQRAEELLLNKWVIIESTKLGIYGRWGAKVYLEDKRLYGDIIREEGLGKKDNH